MGLTNFYLVFPIVNVLKHHCSLCPPKQSLAFTITMMNAIDFVPIVIGHNMITKHRMMVNPHPISIRYNGVQLLFILLVFYPFII